MTKHIIDLESLPYDPDELFANPMVEHTQSDIDDFWRCRTRYWFRYMMLLVPREIQMALFVGSAVHEALAILIKPAYKDDPKTALDRALAHVDMLFDDAAMDPTCIGNTKDKLDQGHAQVVAIVKAYPRVHAGADWSVVDEGHIEWHVRSAPGATLQSAIVDRMAGQLDALICAHFDGDKQWLLERKTRSNLAGLDWTGDLSINKQLIWYNLLARRENTPIHGMLYDVMAKPQHRLSGKHWSDAAQRMEDAIYADPDKYMVQAPVWITEDRLLWATTNFERTIREIDSLTPDRMYCNTSACDDYNGCPYKMLCKAGADAANPWGVLNLPEVALYMFEEAHNELNGGSERTAQEHGEKQQAATNEQHRTF